MEKRVYVGEGVSRIDALGKVRGETKYASDLKLPGMFYGKILYSAHPRALIRKIDIEAARTLRWSQKDYHGSRYRWNKSIRL